MRRILKRFWDGLLSPFHILARAVSKDPEDRPLGDVLEASLSSPSQLFPHIEALRMHLLRMLLFLALAVGGLAIYATQVIDFLAAPINGMQSLVAIEVTETVGVFMQVILLGGFALSIPYIALELWGFFFQGLKVTERTLALVGVPLALILFVLGMAFAYYVLLPVALPFLLNFMGLQTVPRPSSYISFVTGLMFWIGLAFEFPLVVMILTSIRIIKPGNLARQWRIAVVLIAVLAALITPTVDVVNMTLVMLPMVLLFLVSLMLSYAVSLLQRRKPVSKEN